MSRVPYKQVRDAVRAVAHEPITDEELMHCGFRRIHPIELRLTPGPMGSRLALENETLDIDVWGRTRFRLLDALDEQLAVLWHEYVLEQDDVLSAPALELKRALLKHLEPV